MNKHRKRWGSVDIVSAILLTLLAVAIIIPFWMGVVISLETSAAYSLHPVSFFPQEFSWGNYAALLKNKEGIINAYITTIVITVIGTFLGMAISVMAAYGFSRQFPGKKIVIKLVLFTMYFGGGLVPTYILLRDMKLIDTYLGVVLLGLVSVYNIIIMKNSFESVPIELQEAAEIDGANDLQIFRVVMLPLQKPMIATFTLFTIVGYWNSWYWPMILLNSAGKTTLQLYLRSIIVASDSILQKLAPASVGGKTEFSMGIKMAAVFLTAWPIMIIYPFLQKYFAKGVMVGAVKM